MTVQVGKNLFLPFLPIWMQDGIGTASTFQINASGEYYAVALQAPSTEVIDCFSFVTTAVTTGASPAATVDIFAVDAATGNPTGAGLATAQNVNMTTATPGTHEVTGLNFTPTAGTVYAIRVVWAAGDFTVQQRVGTTGQNQPYAVTFDGTTTTKLHASHLRAGYGTTSSVYRPYPQLYGPFTNTTIAYNTSSANDEIGLRFKVRGKLRLWGVTSNFTFGSSAPRIRAWSAPSTGAAVLANGSNLDFSPDKDVLGDTTARPRVWPFPATFDLSDDTEYGISIRSTDANSLTLPYMSFDANRYLGCLFGTDFQYMTRDADAGNFTLTDTRVPAILPIFIGADDGAGGGPPIFIGAPNHLLRM